MAKQPSTPESEPGRSKFDGGPLELSPPTSSTHGAPRDYRRWAAARKEARDLERNVGVRAPVDED